MVNLGFNRGFFVLVRLVLIGLGGLFGGFKVSKYVLFS